MSLTRGGGPLAGPGRHVLHQPFGRRLRAELGGATVLDTLEGVLVHETGRLPVLWVPRAALAEDAPVADAEPPAPELDGFVAPEFAAMDRWLDEDETVRGHLRDPYHRVDPVRSSRPVRVTIDGTEVATSARPVLVAETGLPNRWYLPAADVTTAVERSATSTHCPYKGDATYWEVAGHHDVAWSYASPFDGCQAIAGHLSFDGDGVVVEVG